MSAWSFSHLISAKRASALLQAPRFSEIMELVAGEMEVICCHRRDCDDLHGFSRVIFNLRVSEETFDLFFNSEHGYRGAHFESSCTGLHANRIFIQRLQPLLLAWAHKHEPTFDTTFAQKSLSAQTAKVWLTEFESHLCEKCIGEWGNPADDAAEILNGRWELDRSPNASRGRKAPLLTKIRVFGAFLNDNDDEFVADRKKRRACDLKEFGWS